MIDFNNVILATDSYKTSHFLQYPPGTEYTYFYIESRGGKWDRTVFFGIQAFVQQYLLRPITQKNIEQAADIFGMHGVPFNREGWEYILREHDGYLPLDIKAADEGLVIETGNVLVSVTNTDPKCFWLPGYIETALLRAIWYPTTVATNSWHAKVAILAGLMRSSDNPDAQIDFKLHDFGARGVSSAESAALGGLAHLVNFKGTDTVEAIVAAREYYGDSMPGFSIPAAEHSTITSWGRRGELDAYRNMLRQFAKPGALVAVVSDSYDLMRAVDEMWGDKLRDEVIASGATIVVRPDSGDPLTIPVAVLDSLAARYGTTVNTKGYKVLPDCVRVIQGDGITADSLPKLIENILAAGYALDNIAFGMGGGLLQLVNRDTQRFAMKCSAIRIDGEWQMVGKAPATDPTKRSKQGVLALFEDEHGHFHTITTDPVYGHEGALRLAYRRGEARNETTFGTVRHRAAEAARKAAAAVVARAA